MPTDAELLHKRARDSGMAMRLGEIAFTETSGLSKMWVKTAQMNRRFFWGDD